MRTILEVHVNIPIEKIVTQNIVSSLSFFLIIMLVIIINTDTIINSIEIITFSVGLFLLRLIFVPPYEL